MTTDTGEVQTVYSDRRDRIGFNRDARCAGTQIARIATAVNSSGTTTKTSGSQASTPKRKLAMSRVRPKAAQMPIRTPETVKSSP